MLGAVYSSTYLLYRYTLRLCTQLMLNRCSFCVSSIFFTSFRYFSMYVLHPFCFYVQQYFYFEINSSQITGVSFLIIVNYWKDEIRKYWNFLYVPTIFEWNRINRLPKIRIYLLMVWYHLSSIIIIYLCFVVRFLIHQPYNGIGKATPPTFRLVITRLEHIDRTLNCLSSVVQFYIKITFSYICKRIKKQK